MDRWCKVECFQFDLTPRSNGSLGTLFSRLPTVDLYAFSRLPVACSPSQFAESLLPGMPCRRSNNVTSFSQPFTQITIGTTTTTMGNFGWQWGAVYYRSLTVDTFIIQSQKRIIAIHRALNIALGNPSCWRVFLHVQAPQFCRKFISWIYFYPRSFVHEIALGISLFFVWCFRRHFD